jgi:hypothetical protein
MSALELDENSFSKFDPFFKPFFEFIVIQRERTGIEVGVERIHQVHVLVGGGALEEIQA